MATNSIERASSPASSRRKFLCLVAALKAKGIKSLEQFLAAEDVPKDAPLNQLLIAIEEAKRLQTPRYEKALKRLVEADGSFTPILPPETGWVEFEKLRLGPMKRSRLNEYETHFIWSPVEVWVRFYRSHRDKQVFHLISLLTGESYYAGVDGADWTATMKMMEADNSESFPIQRAPNSQMSITLPALLLSKPLIPITPLVSNVIYA